MKEAKKFVTRFAPSPNGWLHLGHAYSALTAARAAQDAGGDFLLRIEDIDVGRARPHFVEGIYQDLDWLGLAWLEPVMLQSTRFAVYQAALAKLREQELVYPCWATRGDILAAIEAHKDWPRDPDGAPLYPGLYRDLPESRRKQLMWEGKPYCWRLDMTKARARVSEQLSYKECHGQPETLPLDPSAFGDVVLARKDVPTSYHLAVVIDDAAQGVTQVTRGQDLQPATAIHVLLQKLLELPQPDYLHHPLVRDVTGRRLSKQAGDNGFRNLRQEGMSADAVMALLPPPFGQG
ncbi:tRNA glutamyl-Q(34) synthetase GluQRS [Alphaproteobacteria bacterium]|nr:tRNA glutamyl-Q(34) synthetase GluQRS [Alphaproteobacteria bacterium]